MEVVSNIIAEIKEWLWIPLLFVYLGVVLTILLENRNVNKALAYLVLMVFLPVLGFIVFYFFGRDYRKQLKFKKKEKWSQIRSKEFIKKIVEAQDRKVESLEHDYHNLVKPAQILFTKENSLLFNNNRAKLLINGERKFPEIFEAMKSAKHHIHLEYYMLTDDDIGSRVVELLIEKASQGVEVRLMVDGAGSSKLGSIPKKLKKAGIPFYIFMPVSFTTLASSNYRNHRKTLVIDGKVGFVGGINLDDRYINNGKHELFWRDTHLKLEGPVVTRLQFEFITDWEFVSKESLPLSSPYIIEPHRFPDGVPATISGSGPTSSRPYGMDSMVSLIHNSQKEILITNPYFIPSDELRSALITASNSGVKVRIIIPGKSDSIVVQRASFSYLKEMLDNGIEIYLYRKGFVHAKTMAVDGKVSFIGTLNADIRSFYINFETVAIVYDPSLTSQLKEAFLNDLNDCEKVDPLLWANRSVGKRLVDSIFRLLTPLL